MGPFSLFLFFYLQNPIRKYIFFFPRDTRHSIFVTPPPSALVFTHQTQTQHLPDEVMTDLQKEKVSKGGKEEETPRSLSIFLLFLLILQLPFTSPDSKLNFKLFLLPPLLPLSLLIFLSLSIFPSSARKKDGHLCLRQKKKLPTSSL